MGRAFSQAWTHLRQGRLLGVSCQSLVSQSRTKVTLCDLDAEVRRTLGLESGRNVPPVGDVLGVELGELINLILALWVYGYLIHRWQQDSSLQCLRAEESCGLKTLEFGCFVMIGNEQLDQKQGLAVLHAGLGPIWPQGRRLCSLWCCGTPACM